MPNTITLPKNYVSNLDEVYKLTSVTADLTCDSNMVKAGANVGEVLYPQIETTGLGDYDRNSGYTTGGVDLKWKTSACNYDRGTKISVDVMDDQESEKLAFAMGGADLMRTKVAPEADAFTFAVISAVEGISKMEGETFADAAAFLKALIEAKNKMDEDEVPEEGRILYATPTLMNGIMALDTTKSREILNCFAVKRKVPQSRFYTAIDLLDGKTAGEELGHYKKSAAKYRKTSDTSVVSGKAYFTKSGDIYTAVASPTSSGLSDYYEQTSAGGVDINFMIVHKPAVMKYDKHIAHDIIPAKLNSNADADILKYRKYGLVDVYKNKTAGIFLCTK